MKKLQHEQSATGGEKGKKVQNEECKNGTT